MSFKQGDIVSYPNSGIQMQVVCDPKTPDSVICLSHEGGHIYRREVPTQELVKASVH